MGSIRIAPWTGALLAAASGVAVIGIVDLWSQWPTWPIFLAVVTLGFLAGGGVTALCLGALVGIARVVLVSEGVLYGGEAVNRVDIAIVSLFGIGVAGFAMARARHIHAKKETDTNNEPSAWINDRLSAVTALVSAGALIVSSINLFWPVELPSRPRAACPGAQDRSAPYIGITAGADGNNSRQGPSLSYPANGRFPANCTIGFAAYCIGDAITDSSGSIPDVQHWLTSRWLLVAKQSPGWRTRVAHVLSGEGSQDQFIADATITPATPYEVLSYRGNARCPGSRKFPDRAKIVDGGLGTQILEATAEHAVNMGFAVWLPKSSSFIDTNTYQQIFDTAGTPLTNPGATQPDGSKKIIWDTDRLLTERKHGALSTSLVVVMAIPCVADNIPAAAPTADVETYLIAPHRIPHRVRAIRAGYDPARLAHAACQANAV